MAYSPTISGVVSASIARGDLIPSLVSASTFLSNQVGVEGEYSKGSIVQGSQLTTPPIQSYDGSALTVNTAADTDRNITVNQGSGWAEEIVKANQDLSQVGDLAAKYGDLGMQNLAKTMDTYALSQAAATTNQGSEVAISDTTIEGYMEENIETLLTNNVALSNVRAYVPSYVFTGLERIQGRATASNEDAFRAGNALPYMGIKVMLNNNLALKSATFDTLNVTGIPTIGTTIVEDNSTAVSGTAVLVGTELQCFDATDLAIAVAAQADAAQLASIFAANYAAQYVIGSMTAEIVPSNAGQFGLVSQGFAIYGADIVAPEGVVKAYVSKA